MLHFLEKKPSTILLSLAVGVAVFVGVSEWASAYALPIQTLTEAAGGFGIVMYILIMASSIVIAPLGTGFLLPIAVQSFGPFLAGVYSIAGWTLGSLVAFGVVRFLKYEFFNKAKILQQIIAKEQTIPRWYFYLLVLLFRMSLPVDVVSYALALATKISFPMYALLTVVGITPTTFLFTYASNGSTEMKLAVALFGALVFIGGVVLAYRTLRMKNHDLNTI